MTESLQLTDQPLRVRLARSSLVEVILAELLIGHFALQHVVADHQDRVPHRHGSFLGTTPASEASVVRREVGPLERAAARADSVSALRSHFDPLRVFPIKAPLRTKLERYDGTMDEASMTAESLS